MEEWKEYRLGDFMEFNPKRSLSKNTIARKITMDKLVPHTRDIYDWTYEPYSGGAKFQNGDTLMARITPCLENGKQAYVGMLNDGETAFGSTEYIVICGRKSLCDNRFAYYLSLCPTFRNAAIKSMVGTSGRQRAQVDVLENMVMRLPPVPVQLNIVHILSSLDDKIDLNRKINSNLEEQAKALFKSWFIDFEPFKGGKFVDSELGKIPEGWDAVNLLDVSVLFDKRRKPLSGQQRQKMEKLYPYYGATSIMDYVDDYIFDGVYLLMGEDGSVVKSNGSPYLQYVYGKFWPNNHAHVMQGKNGYSTEMLWCLLDLTNVSSIVTGAVQGKISQQSMQKIKVPLPTQEVCDRFNIIINPIFAEIRLLSESSMRLSALRDTLLPKLMSGEIDV